jgi:DHA1 family multidrug resistance protein-like MFS transporter
MEYQASSKIPRSIDAKIFTTLFLSVFVTALGAGLVVPLLPVYAYELGAGSFQISLIFASFSLSRSIFVPYFAKLSDKKGRKPFLTSGLLIYFFLSLLYASSKRVEILIFLRLGQGFASAMILPVAQAYVGVITPAHKEGRIMGLFNISLYIGLTIGPLLGGFVNDWFNIRVSFLSMGVLTLLGFFLCVLFLPKENQAISRNLTHKWMGIPYTVLLRDYKIFSLFAFRTCFTICIGITWTFLPLLASTRLGLSSSAIGLVIMINVLVTAAFQTPMGYLADRFSKKILILAGGIIGVVSILYLNRANSFLDLFMANALLGLSGGISIPAIMALGVIEGRKTKAMGQLMGLLALSHSLGMLLGPILAGVMIELFYLRSVFILGAIILGMGTIIFVRKD